MAAITRSENEFGLKKRNMAAISRSSAKALPEKVFVHVDMSNEHDGEFATAVEVNNEAVLYDPFRAERDSMLAQESIRAEANEDRIRQLQYDDFLAEDNDANIRQIMKEYDEKNAEDEASDDAFAADLEARQKARQGNPFSTGHFIPVLEDSDGQRYIDQLMQHMKYAPLNVDPNDGANWDQPNGYSSYPPK
jgi:hypothetical protein